MPRSARSACRSWRAHRAPRRGGGGRAPGAFRGDAPCRQRSERCLPETWCIPDEVLPELKASFDLDQGFTRLLIGTIILVVLLGITSAQLASVLERRREFAVLSALGMKELSIARLLLLEAGVLALLGAVTGLLLGVPVVYYLATVGIDYGAFIDADLAISNVLIDKVFHADMGFWLVPQALAIALGATLVATVYPAWFAAKTDPASALRGPMNQTALVTVRDVTKLFSTGRSEVQALRAGDTGCAPRRLPGSGRPQRERQDDAAQPDRRARQRHERHDHASRAGSGAMDRRERADTPAHDRALSSRRTT